MKLIETEGIELKEKYNDQLSKEIETFLNTDGGIIYIGVTDNGEVIGVKEVDKTLKAISDIITDQIDPSPLGCVKPEVIFEDGKTIIKVNVSKGYEAIYCIKKYGFSGNGCHIRVGTTCKSMGLEMIKSRFEQSMSTIDLMIKTPSFSEGFSFRKLRVLFEENGFHLEDGSFEKNLKLRTLEGKYNYLAELLSDTNMISFTFAKFQGRDKSTYRERTDYGNQCWVIAYEKMKGRLETENLCRTITTVRPRLDIYLYDFDAVNEALVNAIIHNDYRVAAPQVSFFSNRFEILSYGGLPLNLSKDEFYAGISKPRNERLADIFKRLGFAEETGHGIPTIIRKYGREVFDITDTHINVVIPFSEEIAFGDENDSSILKRGFEDLDSIDIKTLSLIKENHYLTTDEISKRLMVPLRTIKRHISKLKEMGIIKRHGPNKNGFWEIDFHA